MASLLFGGGRNTVARPSDVNPQECTDGENFDLQVGDSSFRPRKPFDLVATATNGSPIRGFAQLVRPNGLTSTLIQAGDTMYEWDLGSTFTSRGTVSASSRLRGGLDQNFNPNSTVIITDLEKQTVVSTWDGTTFQALNHDLGGNFYAKYAVVAKERVFYANVKAGIDIPHMIVGSGLLDPADLTVNDRPSSFLSAADPFYLVGLDLKPINGLTEAFGRLVFSTKFGRILELIGNNAQDFTVENLFFGSNAYGDEAMTNIGNDVLIGRQGALDSLRSIETFADVKTDDVSLWIADEISNSTEWTIVYDRGTQKAFCFPKGERLVHVLHKPILDEGRFSPWSKWTTDHALGFNPQTAFTIIGPEGLPAVYMGDENGNIYRIDGSGSQDAGANDIVTWRESALLKVIDEPTDDINGWVDYVRPESDLTLTLTHKYAGRTVDNQEQTLTLPAELIGEVYAGTAYYGGTFYYGAENTGRLHRQWFQPAGDGSAAQIRTSVTDSQDFRIDEILYEA